MGMKTRWRVLRTTVVTTAIVFLAVTVVKGIARDRWARPLAGTTERQLVVGGVTRTYLLHAGGEAKPGRALVLVLHGHGGTAAGIERRTRGTFDRLADRDGAVVVYPQASGHPAHWGSWRISPPGWGQPPDDLGFIAALIDALANELAIDRARVFAAGFSNGSMMVYRLACERPDLVAGVAPVGGGMSPDVAKACRQGAPVSIIAMHGTDDPIVPFDASIRDGMPAWAERDGCPAQPSTLPLPDADPSDGTRTRVDTYAPCAAGAEVAFYTIEGGGHAWPGGTTPFAFKSRGNTPADFDAGAVIWDFFQKHGRGPTPITRSGP
jgi:polyhydroxybutyrate depolymerase